MEFVESLLEIVGGVTVVVTATLVFCKSVIEKVIHTQIEKSANKELEIAKSNLSRSMSAYEILLKKEIDYYQSIDRIYAELVVDVHDFKFYSIESPDIDSKVKKEQIRNISLRALQSIKDLKSLNLIYQIYVPIDIFSITGNVIKCLQDNCELISETASKVFEQKECDENKINKFTEDILLAVATANAFIKNRLNQLSQ
ncbi:hypothetical protein [Enterocloster lavalensis]|uniref:hypothetical protein n=1 Tax=Enterocloster lavalensis TaxID=460384 RepID=UPI001D07B859|nr:hypothetical protein [Enterocloster lavalensis]MCB6343674.1 hypothetical protein [Enterocloster lavalensis]